MISTRSQRNLCHGNSGIRISGTERSGIGRGSGGNGGNGNLTQPPSLTQAI